MRQLRLTLLFIIIALFTGCSSAPLQTQQTIFAMDTVMSVTVYGENSEKNAADAAAEINRLSCLWSATDENSEIYRLNHSEGAPVEVSPETAELISLALQMGESTDGALDITLYPVLQEWGFATDEYKIPTAECLSELLSQREAPAIDGKTVTLSYGTQIDLGAVAKGHTGDILCELLTVRGVTSALLDLGGNIHAIGSKPDGSDWRLGIKDPHGDGNIAVLELSGKAAVTSGDYERYFIGEDGKKYCHILDPKTGIPVDNELSSVTIVAEKGVLCDALSTALFVMGREGAERYWLDNGGFEMILISDKGDIIITEGIEEDFYPLDDYSDMITVIKK